MDNFITILITGLIMAILIFVLSWKDEKSRREHLEEILYRADKRIKLLEKTKPRHYVPTRHFNTARMMGENVGSFQESDDYEKLEVAVRNGSFVKTKT